MDHVSHSLLEPFHLLADPFVEDFVRPIRSPEEGILVGVGVPLPGLVRRSWCLQLGAVLPVGQEVMQQPLMRIFEEHSREEVSWLSGEVFLEVRFE